MTSLEGRGGLSDPQQPALFKAGKYRTQEEYRAYLEPLTGEARAIEIAALEFGGPGDVIIIDEQGLETPAIPIEEDTNAG
jgi:hypothetical protein